MFSSIYKDFKFKLVTSLGLVLILSMIILFIILILMNSWRHFWPAELNTYRMNSGKIYLGKKWKQEQSRFQNKDVQKIQIEIGNRDILGHNYVWLGESNILTIEQPRDAVIIERWRESNFYGFLIDLNYEKSNTQNSNSNIIDRFRKALALSNMLHDEIRRVQSELDQIKMPLIQIENRINRVQLISEKSDDSQNYLEVLLQRRTEIEREVQNGADPFLQILDSLVNEQNKLFCEVRTIDDTPLRIQLADVVRLYYPNSMNYFTKTFHSLEKLKEYIFESPRNSNTAGGIFPAIFSTILLVFMMTLIACPLGILTAFYLAEYARPGMITNLIRALISNLAGVPSIVIGMFGLGFFIYGVGGSIDEFFFSDTLPQPTFGTGGILWASLTLTLLTLPIVIMVTDEGVRTVSKQYKEAAHALGASQWQIVTRILLPRSLPMILTAVILSIGRAAGAVAPLMLTGVVKLTSQLPFDTDYPFLHLERKFMHLGFHIFDLGFQSRNIDEAIPMIFATTLILVTMVVGLNLIAFYLRNFLRTKYQTVYL
jgi:phosphate transport system permease protein